MTFEVVFFVNTGFSLLNLGEVWPCYGAFLFLFVCLSPRFCWCFCRFVYMVGLTIEGLVGILKQILEKWKSKDNRLAWFLTLVCLGFIDFCVCVVLVGCFVFTSTYTIIYIVLFGFCMS